MCFSDLYEFVDFEIDENFGNERSTNLEIHKDMHICVLWIYKNFGSAPMEHTQNTNTQIANRKHKL